MSEESLLGERYPELGRQLMSVGMTDLLVAVPSFNNEGTIERTVQAIEECYQRNFVRDRVVIEGDDAHHLARSLRARPGEEIEVVDPEGFMLKVRLEVVTPARVEGAAPAASSPRRCGRTHRRKTCD